MYFPRRRTEATTASLRSEHRASTKLLRRGQRASGVDVHKHRHRVGRAHGQPLVLWVVGSAHHHHNQLALAHAVRLGDDGEAGHRFQFVCQAIVPHVGRQDWPVEKRCVLGSRAADKSEMLLDFGKHRRRFALPLDHMLFVFVILGLFVI